MMRPALSGLLLSIAMACSGPSSNGLARKDRVDASLYVRLGGVDALRVLVDEWILEVSSDARIREYFAEADMGTLKLRLVERICLLVDGPCVYRGRDLYEAHSHLQLEDRHLTAFLEGLEPAMRKVNIDGNEAQELRDRVRGLAAELAIAMGSESR